MNRVSRVLSVQTASVARRMMSSGKHEPPKKVFGPNGRYAMATFTAASKVSLFVLNFQFLRIKLRGRR